MLSFSTPAQARPAHSIVPGSSCTCSGLVNISWTIFGQRPWHKTVSSDNFAQQQFFFCLQGQVTSSADRGAQLACWRASRSILAQLPNVLLHAPAAHGHRPPFELALELRRERDGVSLFFGRLTWPSPDMKSRQGQKLHLCSSAKGA